MSKPIYSWTRLALRTASAAAGVEGRPTKLIFVVTKRCHSRCVYCDIWKLKETPGALDNELTLDEVKSLAKARTGHACFHENDGRVLELEIGGTGRWRSCDLALAK